MLISDFFIWWYGRGWKQVASSLGPRIANTSKIFSVGQLFRTLFEPWRRIITFPGSSLEQKFRAWADNMFSRAVGFVVRLLVLLAAGVTLAIVTALSVFEMLAWPLLPILAPILLIAGLMR